MEAKDSYEWLETIVRDLTPEQVAWNPAGTANTIAANYAHIVVNADVDITKFFHGRNALVETNDWIVKLGLNATQLDDWDSYAGIDWSLLHEYGLEVQRHVQRLAAELTQEDLDRQFQMVPETLGAWSGLDVYRLHTGGHVWMHGGEIACLKGLQGKKGYAGFMPEHLRAQGAKND